jgi:hypothetical protein
MKVNACNSGSGLSRRIIFIERKVETCHGGLVAPLAAFQVCSIAASDSIQSAAPYLRSRQIQSQTLNLTAIRSAACAAPHSSKTNPKGFKDFGPSSVSLYY